MSIWAIADLHLSFGIPNKQMDIFGPDWAGHADKVAENWRAVISNDDLVLIPGDISWAMRLEEVVPDLQWIHQLPGTKLMIRGNHDYWWSSLSKIKTVLPSSIHLIQNNAFQWNDFVVGGTRLWDTSEYRFNADIYKTTFREISSPDKEAPFPEISISSPEKNREEMEVIYLRELVRLELSLKEMAKTDAKNRIVMTHYPPIGVDLGESRAAALLEKYQVNYCLFGHLHNVKNELQLFGKKNGVDYRLTACDYLQFKPLKVA